jgi:hypothetical protein
MKPLHTGLALAATVALFYSLCALVEVTWPDQFMGFMNGLFHGLDFRKLVTTEAYNWSSFLNALVILAVWAFAAGAFFAWIHNALSSVRGRHVMQHE